MLERLKQKEMILILKNLILFNSTIGIQKRQEVALAKVQLNKIIIFKGEYKILKTGLKMKIGDPHSYYDCVRNKSFPEPKLQN